MKWCAKRRTDTAGTGRDGVMVHGVLEDRDCCCFMLVMAIYIYIIYLQLVLGCWSALLGDGGEVLKWSGVGGAASAAGDCCGC